MSKHVKLEWTRTVEYSTEAVLKIPDDASEKDLEFINEEPMSIVAQEATKWEADFDDESPMTVTPLYAPSKPDLVFDWGEDGQLKLVEDDDKGVGK